MQLLNGITQKELLEFVDDPEKCECVGLEILKLAHSFIAKNNISGTDNEDYAQDLFMEVWKRLDQFDETKGSFSTFCYLWFKSYRSNTIRRKKDLLVLDKSISDDENITLLDTLLVEEENNDDLQQEIQFALTNASDELKLWCAGYLQQEIAIKLNTTQAQVSRMLNKELEQIRKSLGIKKENGYYYKEA